MTKRRQVKLIQEGEFVAQVDVEFIYTGEGWSPYLSLDDARKLDDVRESLRRGDFKAATAQSARIFRLTPVAIAA
jgi:hypothetical protein